MSFRRHVGQYFLPSHFFIPFFPHASSRYRTLHDQKLLELMCFFCVRGCFHCSQRQDSRTMVGEEGDVVGKKEGLLLSCPPVTRLRDHFSSITIDMWPLESPVITRPTSFAFSWPVPWVMEACLPSGWPTDFSIAIISVSTVGFLPPFRTKKFDCSYTLVDSYAKERNGFLIWCVKWSSIIIPKVKLQKCSDLQENYWKTGKYLCNLPNRPHAFDYVIQHIWEKTQKLASFFNSHFYS